MIRFDLGKYINYVKNELDFIIEDQYIEKDFLLSLFLSTWQNLQEKGEVKSLGNLIFKGGTLLIRNYLTYPRISEDLDFTHKNCNEIRKMSQNRRIKTIRTFIIPILKDIKKICDSCGFDFRTNRDDTTYITAYNHKSVYSLSIYRTSEITNLPIKIKIEINFVEHLQYTTKMQLIQHIVNKNAVLSSLGYDLVAPRLSCYTIKELALEKYRAILTREKLKERDIFDLYLIDKRQKDVLKIDNRLIFKKIVISFLISQSSQGNLANNCKKLDEGFFGVSDDDIKRLTLIEIDDKDYEEFKNRLFDKLKDICNIRI